MFKNTFLKTIYDFRLSIFYWGMFFAFLLLFIAGAYNEVIVGADSANVLAGYKKLANMPGYPGGGAPDADTFGGFITFRMLGGVPLILGIFGVLAGSLIIRGEEDKGSLDLILSTPHSRTMVLLQKWAGMAVAIGAVVLINWLALILGLLIANQQLGFADMFLAHLNIWLTCLVFGSLALLLGQITISRRAAAGWAGGVLAATYLLDSLASSLRGLEWLRYLSPFYYYSLSKPLAPSVGTHWGALVVLAGISAVAVVVAVWFYNHRDHNNVYPLFFNRPKPLALQPQTRPTSLGLRGPFWFGLRSALPGTLIWGLPISLYLGLSIYSIDGVRGELTSLLKSELYRSQGFLPVPSDANLVSLSLALNLVVFTAYAVVQVVGWTSEESEGRLELILSTPQPRWRLLLTRYLVNLLASAITCITVGTIFSLIALLVGVKLDFSYILASFFGLWVVCAVIMAAGFALSAIRPGRSIALISGGLVVFFFVDSLGGILKLPDWFINLSVYRAYGKPLMGGVDWTPQFVMLGLSAVFVTIAVYFFRRRDIVK